MKLLSWLGLGLITTSLLCLIGSLILLFMLCLGGKRQRKLIKAQKKNQKKRQRGQFAINSYQRAFKKKRTLLLCLTALTLVLSIGSSVNYQYLRTHLTSSDQQAIIKGHYLLREVEKQLEGIPLEDNQPKVQNNLKELSGQLSSYGVQTASSNLTASRQRKLNYYYYQLKEVGLNLANQGSAELLETQVSESYLRDVAKIKESQDELVKTFKLTETSALATT